MIALVILFLASIHFIFVPNIHLLQKIKLSPLAKNCLVVGLFIASCALITFTNMFRIIAPGKSTWKRKNILRPLIIERSVAGVIKFIYWVATLLIFSLTLYAVSYYIIHLYWTNVPAILNGTYEYDRMEAAWMEAPLIIVFMLILYFGIQLYEYVMNIKHKKNKHITKR